MEFTIAPVSGPHEPRRRRSRQQVPKTRGPRMFIGAIAGIVLALGVFGAVAWQRLDQIQLRFGASRSRVQAPTASESAPAVKKIKADSRPVYRYSVVPGGVRSPEELIEAMARDDVVAGHYAGVDKEKLTAGRLDKPLKAHVSYRVGDRVYWTKRKITLEAGEQVLTDGQTLVRGRCGNNVSVDPLLPTLDNEPKPDVFDSIVDPLASSTRVQLDPAHSYFTPRDLKTPQDAGSGRTAGNPPAGGAFFGPPPTGGGTTGTPSGPSADETPNGNPPGGNPPGNPPVEIPCVPPAVATSRVGDRPAVVPNCTGNPPRGNPPGGGPPSELPPLEIPNPPTPVPEPGTLVLIGGGAALLLARRIRKKSSR